MNMSPSAGTRRSRKRRQTAEHIVTVAFELFARHGYATVTMEQIAAEADIAKGTLYNYFPVKEALVRHRMQMDMAEQLPGLLAALPKEASCPERLRAFMHIAAGYMSGFREYLPPYIHYRLSQPLDLSADTHTAGLIQVFIPLLAEGQAAGQISGRHTAEFLAINLQFLHLSTLLRWLATPGLELADAFDEMLDLFFQGCARGEAP